MGVTFQKESGDVWIVRVTGVMRKSEQDTILAAASKDLAAGGTARLLVIAEDFRGWESGADWGDMTFLVKHGNQIKKIAIVADPQWETQFLMFVGAGFRRAPVKFFPAGLETQARTWLD